MERTVPKSASDEIDLYLRTIYSLLRSSTEVQIRTLEEVHAGEPLGTVIDPAGNVVLSGAAEALRSLGPLDDDALGVRRGATRRRLREAVARSEVDGATGRVRFDANGDRRQGVALYSVEKDPPGPPRFLVRGWLGEP